MRVVVTALGTFGDVAPLLRIARALEAQGDSALVLVNPFFEDHARGLGLSVRPVGKSWDPEAIATDPRFQDPSQVWREVFAPRIRDDFAATLSALDEAPTAGVVNHFWCHGGALAAEARGLPWATVALAPLTWLSSDEPSQLPGRRMPRWLLGPVIRWLVRPRTRRQYEPAAQQAARELGLRAVRDRFWGMQTRATLNVGLWSALWRGPARDDPPSARIVGFPGSSPAARIEPELDAFLAAGDPPVVMGLGSVLPKISAALYRGVAEACAELGRRAVLVGAPAEVAAGLGPDVRATASAPYAAVFPRASVVVHHGGVGSTAEALRAGKPALVLPFGNDQNDNAWRVERLGAAITLDRRLADGSRLRGALLRCLTSERLTGAAASVARRIGSEEHGEAVAAREIRRALGS
ncbi:MAG TPA: glycosyltransferase, partial [Polyangiaceae bacterium]|nr:glycosyltransferase [Polyangiaceae bacterium]